MPYESPEDYSAVQRGARASDPEGYGTAFEIQERRNDGATPDSQKGREGFWWQGLVGIGILSAAVIAGWHVFKQENKK